MVLEDVDAIDASSLDYALQLLFLASQVDISWTPTPYSWTPPSGDRETRKSATKTCRTLLPKLKQNIANVIETVRHKVAKAFLCLSCVQGEEDDPAFNNLGASKVFGSKEDTGRGLITISQTIDSGIASEDDPQSNSIYEPSITSCEWEDSDLVVPSTSSTLTATSTPLPRDHDPTWFIQTAAEGRRSFQESRAAALEGRQTAAALHHVVSCARGNLRTALGQLWLVECKLNDHRWETLDRDTWTQRHLLAPVANVPCIASRLNFVYSKADAPV